MLMPRREALLFYFSGMDRWIFSSSGANSSIYFTLLPVLSMFSRFPSFFCSGEKIDGVKREDQIKITVEIENQDSMTIENVKERDPHEKMIHLKEERMKENREAIREPVRSWALRERARRKSTRSSGTPVRQDAAVAADASRSSVRSWARTQYRHRRCTSGKAPCRNLF